MIWPFSGVPDNREDDTVIEKHGAEALYSAVKSLMHATQTEDKVAQQDVAHRMIQIAKDWTICRWSESTLANAKILVQMTKQNACLIDLDWTDDKQAQLKTLMKRHTA